MCADKNANAAVEHIVWIQDGSLVACVDGQLTRLTMQPPRLINSNLEGTPLRIVEHEKDFGMLKQPAVAKINKNAADDILKTDNEVIYCSPQNILNKSQPDLKFRNVTASENHLIVVISSSGDREFLAIFHKREKPTMSCPRFWR